MKSMGEKFQFPNMWAPNDTLIPQVPVFCKARVSRPLTPYKPFVTQKRKVLESLSMNSVFCHFDHSNFELSWCC